MDKEFIISDTHFGDNGNGIIKFEDRPFTNGDDMINTMTEYWNKVVSEQDTVYHLGDVFWELEDTRRKEIIKELNGHKILIMGNHDRNFDISYWMDLGFEKVYDVPVIINGFTILSHEPLYMTYGPYINIFGHVHGNRAYKDYSETSFCACVERELINYRPFDLSKVIDLCIKARDEKE